MRGVVVGLMVPLALAGCAGSQATQAESAGGTVDTLIRTCAEDRPAASLEMLSTPARVALVNAPSALQGCLDLLGLRFAGVPRTTVERQLSATRVVSVEANDLTAAAELSTPGGERSHVRLENSRGEWFVTHGVSAQ